MVWHWQNGVLRCELLAAWPHGFFTRHHGEPQTLQLWLQSDRSCYAKQVHGDRTVDGPWPATVPRPEADGVAVQTQGVSAWVCTADCVPVLVGDRRLGWVAAVHSGWRGTAADVLGKLLQRWQAQGSCPSDWRVALGPAISGAVYQVPQTVAAEVTAVLQQPVGIAADPAPDKCRLDLRAVLRQRLLEWGLSAAQVAIAPHCTLSEPDRFFSYRRRCLNVARPEPRGLQWSGITAIAPNP
ncbi:MAG: peptidoglycan editing factor PgeF [Oscillatoriales cyanobacterium SM2_1_8]|nr:peptidoglycan editing factor PgeF [Oscillatoriales cyanobacterium SM2_1_8]